eukprot:m.207553 g.207553  ORF g.207553 m.207553 type:complete len:416 (+) comp18930_c0_seq5:1508-2755(+)
MGTLASPFMSFGALPLPGVSLKSPTLAETVVCARLPGVSPTVCVQAAARGEDAGCVIGAPAPPLELPRMGATRTVPGPDGRATAAPMQRCGAICCSRATTAPPTVSSQCFSGTRAAPPSGRMPSGALRPASQKEPLSNQSPSCSATQPAPTAAMMPMQTMSAAEAVDDSLRRPSTRRTVVTAAGTRGTLSAASSARTGHVQGPATRTTVSLPPSCTLPSARPRSTNGSVAALAWPLLLVILPTWVANKKHSSTDGRPPPRIQCCRHKDAAYHLQTVTREDNNKRYTSLIASITHSLSFFARSTVAAQPDETISTAAACNANTASRPQPVELGSTCSPHTRSSPTGSIGNRRHHSIHISCSSGLALEKRVTTFFSEFASFCTESSMIYIMISWASKGQSSGSCFKLINRGRVVYWS